MRKYVVSAASAVWASFALAALAAAPAAAEDTTVYVTYADLNLTTSEGVETLEGRIAAAVKTACARPETIRDLKSMAAWESCKLAATKKAREQVDVTIELASL